MGEVDQRDCVAAGDQFELVRLQCVGDDGVLLGDGVDEVGQFGVGDVVE